jgi:biopolymer transport protein ExbD
MKMKGAKQVHYDAGPNMTPLVDVVMVILIFLMLAGKFGGEEQYLASNVPIKQKGTPVPNQTVPNDVELKINVDPAGSDRFVARMEGDDNTYSEIKPLTDALSAKLAQFLAIGKKPDDIQVLISPSSTLQYNYMVQVYAAALSAETDSGGKKEGYTKVAFEAAH